MEPVLRIESLKNTTENPAAGQKRWTALLFLLCRGNF